jgi:hypothetical protein
MTPGIYKAGWLGRDGHGGGLLVLMYNKISGADWLGCIFDGEYAIDAQGQIAVRWLNVKIPPGVSLAQGGGSQQVEQVVKIPPFSFDIHSVFRVPTTPSPLSVELTCLRRLEP